MSSITVYCPNCREQVIARKDGKCVWCDTQTGDVPVVEPEARVVVTRHARRTREALMEQLGIVKRGTMFFVGDSLDATVCVCGGGKSKQSLVCHACRKTQGYHSDSTRIFRPGHQARHITEDQIQEARRRYLAGESFNALAKSMLADTGYSSWQTCASGLCRIFKARGWPARERIQATVAASYKHGLKKRDTQRGYNRLKREREGKWRPYCKGVRRQHPRKGEPCKRKAMFGSDYCVAHDPDRAAELAQHIRSVSPARVPSPPVERVLVAPLSAWLLEQYERLGAWKEVAALVEQDHNNTYGYAHPAGKHRTRKVLRSTVERMLAAARSNGTQVSFEDLYGKEDHADRAAA
jgi:hypothetical protein